MHEGISPTYNVNLIGHSIFMNTYDGRLLCYEGLVCSVRVSGVGCAIIASGMMRKLGGTIKPYKR